MSDTDVLLEELQTIAAMPINMTWAMGMRSLRHFAFPDHK